MALFNKEKRIQYLGFDDFWFLIAGILLTSLVSDYLINNSFSRFGIGMALISWSVPLFFSTFYWIVIRFILISLRKKYPSFRDDVKRTLILVFSIICTVFIFDFLGGKLVVFIFNLFTENTNYITQIKDRVSIILIIVLIMAVYEAIFYYVRLKKSIKKEEQAKQIIIQAQLDALKNQAQPHFLFNSLNTLRDIIDQDSKEDAKGFVDNLSDVYRFILEAGNASVISLQEEIKFTNAYIHIQLERFGNNLKVNWNISENQLNSMVIPMSLQLLIENAIKHNVVSKSKPLVITIEVINDYLVVSNKIQAKSTKVASTKIGLQNIEKRYSLISEKLPIIENDGNEFVVSLPLLKTNLTKSYANTNR